MGALRCRDPTPWFFLNERLPALFKARAENLGIVLGDLLRWRGER